MPTRVPTEACRSARRLRLATRRPTPYLRPCRSRARPCLCGRLSRPLRRAPRPPRVLGSELAESCWDPCRIVPHGKGGEHLKRIVLRNAYPIGPCGMLESKSILPVIDYVRWDYEAYCRSPFICRHCHGAGIPGILFLLPGAYGISVAATGFKRLERSGVEVRTDSRGTIDAQLELGTATDSVTVTAGAELLDESTSDLTRTVTTDFVRSPEFAAPQPRGGTPAWITIWSEKTAAVAPPPARQARSRTGERAGSISDVRHT